MLAICHCKFKFEKEPTAYGTRKPTAYDNRKRQRLAYAVAGLRSAPLVIARFATLHITHARSPPHIFPLTDDVFVQLPNSARQTYKDQHCNGEHDERLFSRWNRRGRFRRDGRQKLSLQISLSILFRHESRMMQSLLGFQYCPFLQRTRQFTRNRHARPAHCVGRLRPRDYRIHVC